MIDNHIDSIFNEMISDIRYIKSKYFIVTSLEKSNN